MATPKINLLPYREERIKASKIRFLIFLGASAAAAGVIIAIVHTFFGLQMTKQEVRNNVLSSDIAVLDKQIDKIKQLRQEIAAAVSRKQVVESLQANRSRAVMLLNQIVQPPANIFYQSIVQRADSITLSGIAPSNTSVSSLIKQIETSDILLEPKLVETKTVTIDGVQMTSFIMNAKIVDLAKVAADRERIRKNKLASTPPVSATSSVTTPASPVAALPDPEKAKMQTPVNKPAANKEASSPDKTSNGTSAK